MCVYLDQCSFAQLKLEPCSWDTLRIADILMWHHVGALCSSTFPHLKHFKSCRLDLNITAKNQNWQFSNKNAVDVKSLPCSSNYKISEAAAPGIHMEEGFAKAWAITCHSWDGQGEGQRHFLGPETCPCLWGWQFPSDFGFRAILWQAFKRHTKSKHQISGYTIISLSLSIKFLPHSPAVLLLAN